MEVQVFSLLCALAAVGFSASADTRRAFPYWLAGLLLVLLTATPSLASLTGGMSLLAIEPSQFAVLVLLAAIFKIIKPDTGKPIVLLGGAFTGVWLNALLAQGLPATFALPTVLVASLAALFLPLCRKGFRNPQVLEEAMIIILLTALLTAFVPEIIKGWQSTVNLAVESGGGPEQGLLAPLLVAGLFIILGGFYANWKYTR